MNYYVALGVLTFPVIPLFGWAIFKDRYDFFDAIKHIFTPDIFSAFAGEWHEDTWNSMKIHIMLMVWLLLAMGVHFRWSNEVKVIMSAVG